MPRPPRIVYQQGDHVCTLYGSREEQLDAAIEYLRAGFERKERCLYVCGEHTPDEFRLALRQAGIDAEAEEARGALILLTKHDGHLKGGAFDPGKMIDLLKAAVEDALSAGFKGLCAAGDMSWVMDEAPGTELLIDYEARLNDFYSRHQALGLCQYHRRKLPEKFLDTCIATHPRVRMAGSLELTNPFYELPAEAVKRPRAGRDVKVMLQALDAAALG